MISRRDALLLRSAFFARVRAFFASRGFVEADTPLLVEALPLEATFEPFEVRLQRLGGAERRFLPTSPEAWLKRLVVELERDVFELGHSFRNGEEEGPRHRAHFRMLEWYRRDADYRAIQDDTEALLQDLAAFVATQDIAAVTPPRALANPAPERLSVPDAFARHLGHRIEGPADLAALLEVAHRHGHTSVSSWEEAFHVLHALHVEPHLGRERPTFLTDYPAGIATQARPHADRPWLAEQFEVYVDGIELGNSYSELTDADRQAERFTEEAARIRAAGREPPPADTGLLAALRRLPERTAGGSMGLERLLMVWVGARSLDDVRPERSP